MTHANDGQCRGWHTALTLAAGLGAAITFSSSAGASEFTVSGEARSDIQRLVVAEAVHHGSVPAPLALAVAEVSSDFVPRTVGTSGAIGVMQLEPAVAASEFGVAAESLWDPTTNVRLGLQYLSRLHQRYYGDWELALSHFQGGSLHWMNGNYVPHAYTHDWLQRVMYHWRFYQREPLVRAWIREARGAPRFTSVGVPRYAYDPAPYRSTSLRWPCACERCWKGHSQRARYCEERLIEMPRPDGSHRFNGGGIRWSPVEGGGWTRGYRSGSWVAITGGNRFK